MLCKCFRIIMAFIQLLALFLTRFTYAVKRYICLWSNDNTIKSQRMYSMTSKCMNRLRILILRRNDQKLTHAGKLMTCNLKILVQL